MSDLFKQAGEPSASYSAQDIEVLEGLEPVRRRPGMYIGGTDDSAVHHLVAEILDNAMDEAVAGHAHTISLTVHEDGSVSVSDDGRGIPVDEHPKYPGRSALEIIMTTLHSGGKFGGKAYSTSGGLHGVGLSVVNALSESLEIEVARDGNVYRQSYGRGQPLTPLTPEPLPRKRTGTLLRFRPDPDIFGPAAVFDPARLYRMARAKAYLFRGVHIRWRCSPNLAGARAAGIPETADLHFPGGLTDYLTATLGDRETLTTTPFVGEAPFPGSHGRVEWALTWPEDGDGFMHTFCNTIPTPQGGTHESGFRQAISRALKAYGELVGNKKMGQVTPEDVLGEAAVVLSVFIREPQFQGQTKEKLATPEAARLVEQAVKDRFEHWLTSDPQTGKALVERIVERAEDRIRRRQAKETARKSATRKLRLPGKLADCSRSTAAGTEIFLVEGDSAGGSAKQARNRETQAILPLRGKILNVASASPEKLRANQEINDLLQALGCGAGREFDRDKLRYDRVIIMTDADVDGAHIASLLMTFFYRELPGLIEHGHLYLAMPPLYRLSAGGKSVYARDDAHRDQLLGTVFKGRSKVDISRFKGLGEMLPAQLKETTMHPAKRTLLRVQIANGHDAASAASETKTLVETLMGRKAELRFRFIQENAKFADNIDV